MISGLMILLVQCPELAGEFVLTGRLDLLRSEDLVVLLERWRMVTPDHGPVKAWTVAAQLLGERAVTAVADWSSAPLSVASSREAFDDLVFALEERWCVRKRTEYLVRGAPDKLLDELDDVLAMVREARQHTDRPSCSTLAPVRPDPYGPQGLISAYASKVLDGTDGHR